MITFDTYANMFLDNDGMVENPDYDDQVRLFDVPKDWAVDWIFIQYRINLHEFLDEYTWDDTYQMYEDAIKDGVLINSRVESR